MASPLCERAIEDATRSGNAILKFISPNDTGLTGSHQSGFYLPKSVWPMYTPHAPEKGRNDEHAIRILWQDGRVTDSRIKWYGVGTRSEYRLTRFGRDFPFLTADNVGDLLVLIPRTTADFVAYVFDRDDDIEEIQASLGVEPFERWGVYQNGVPQIETEDDCVERNFRVFADPLEAFPDGNTFSATAHRVLTECVREFRQASSDETLMMCMDTEYRLFRFVERRICQPDISRLFRDVDDFLQTAARIMNRRKARAGRSLENHVDFLLTQSGVPHVMRPSSIDGEPDVVIPDERAYHDDDYPRDKLFVVGVKTTCKDRWRQVLNEGRKVPRKHILTMQQGISTNQLREMGTANITLVVPQRLHRDYPPDRPVTMQNVSEFIETVRQALR